MRSLLFLVHRIPYPPNKGDKIRSYHQLKFFSRHFRVQLGAFVDDRADWRYRDEVAKYCERLLLVPLHGVSGRLRSLRGFLTGEPLTLPYYRSRAMTEWVNARVGEGVDAVVVFSSSMIQYVDKHRELSPRVVDFVDLDSEKWKQYGAARRGLSGAVYRREGTLLADYERRVAREFSACVLVSEAEGEPLRRAAPEAAERVYAIGNGVDHAYFDPLVAMESPYEHDEKAVVFTGAMDYWANVDAVVWFAREVWPAVIGEQPSARFYIVGARPTRAVQELCRLPGVRVTGTVKDIRPFLKFASVAVAPLRVARGIQNKVLEAMSMGLPVVATRAAGEGLSKEVTDCIDIADAAPDLAARVSSALRLGRSSDVAARNRDAVVTGYDWERSAELWAGLLGVSATVPSGARAGPSSGAAQ